MTSQNKNKIIWQNFFSRGSHPLLYVDSVMIAHKNFFHSYFGLPKIGHWARHSGTLWIEKGEMGKIYEEIRKKIYTTWPLKIIKKMKKDLIILNNYVKRAEPDKIFFKKIFKLMYPAWQSTYFPILMGKVIEEEVVKFTGHLTRPATDKIYNLLNQPLYSPLQQKYFNELKNIKELSDKEVKSLIKKYGWIKGYLMEVKPLTKKEILSDLKEAKNKNKNKVKNIRLKVSKKISKLIYLGRLYCWFRDWRLFELSRFFYYLKPALEIYGRNLNLGYNELRQLKVSEFLTKKFNLKNIKQRERGYAILLINGKIQVVSGKKLKEVKTRISEPVKKTNIIFGKIANKGLAKGKIWVANAYTFSKPHTGDILVTPETTPDSLPYLRNIKAIITDEGGITSHAAIISRELKIPCIIGTKNGSKLLRDGDLVEVNANEGTVKIIKKAV